MKIRIIKRKTTKKAIRKIAAAGYGEMVKCTIDLKKGILTVGGELHADGEKMLLQTGSRSEDIWGANIYLNKSKKGRIEYSALINLKPSLGNRAMNIQDKKIREKIRRIINKLIP